MNSLRWLAAGLAVCCLCIAAAEVSALTLYGRPDNIAIGVGLKGPPSVDNVFTSTLPAPGHEPEKELVQFDVEVCCVDCNAAVAGGEPCGPDNCTPTFTVEFTVFNSQGAPFPPASEDFPPAENCPKCVTYTIVAVVDTVPNGQGSARVDVTNIPADCICCEDENAPWAKAYSFGVILHRDD